MNDLAKYLGQAQKRLRYRKELLGKHAFDAKVKEEIQGLLSTCGLLLSKVVKSTTDLEKQETLARLLATENKLEALFASARLMTHSVGTPSVQHLSNAWDK